MKKLRKAVCVLGSFVMLGSFAAGFSFAKPAREVSADAPTVTEITVTQESGDTNWYPAGGAAFFHTDVALPGSAWYNYGPVEGFGDYKSGYFNIDGKPFTPATKNKYIRPTSDAKKVQWDIDDQLLTEGKWNHTILDLGGLYKSDEGHYIYFKNDIHWGYKNSENISFFDLTDVNEEVTLSDSTNGDSTYISYSGATDTSIAAWNEKWVAYGGTTKYNGVETDVSIEVVNSNLVRAGAMTTHAKADGDTFEIGGKFAKFVYSTKKLHIWNFNTFKEVFATVSDKVTLLPEVKICLDGAVTKATQGGNCSDANWAAINIKSTNPITRDINWKGVSWYDAAESAKKAPKLQIKKNGAATTTCVLTVIDDTVSFGCWKGAAVYNVGDILTIEGSAIINNNWVTFEYASFVKDETAEGYFNLTTVTTSMSLGFKYTVSGEGTVSGDEFRVRFAVNEKVGTLVGNSIWYGLKVSCGSKEVSYDNDHVHHDTENGLYYVTIDLGAAITNGHLNDKFTVKGYMKHGDGYGYTAGKVMSIADMVDTYYAMPAYQDQVADLYNRIHA